MAIIRLDCNLNGGDSVTPNNELFYRIYGDIDAYASPIHTTGTALSDANVTVDNDNVIITGVDGTTNNSFKIAAVDAAFNEGVLSDAFSSNILFEDDFAGTTLNPLKWSITSDSANCTASQNNALIFTDTNTITASGGTERVSTEGIWSYDNTGGKDLVMIIDIDDSGITVPDAPSGGFISNVGFTNRAGVITQLDEDIARLGVSNGGVFNVTDTAVEPSGQFKITLIGGVASLYKWNGSWGSALATDTYTEVTDNFVYIQRDTKFNTGDVWKVNSVYILNEDIATVIP